MANKNTQSQKIMSPAVLATMIVCGILLVAVIVFSVVVRSGFYLKQQEAVKVGDDVVNSVEYGYFYANAYTNFMNTYGNYLSLLGYDSKLSPAQQTTKYGEQTWVEYFCEQASAAAVQQSLMVQEGKKAGFTVDETEQKEYVDSTLSQLEVYAKFYNYSLKAYLEAAFGDGMDEATLRKCLEAEFYASKYATHLYDSIEVSDAEAEEYKNENLAALTTFNGRAYTYKFTANDEDSKAEALASATAHVAAATSSEAFEQYVQDQLLSDEEEEDTEKETEEETEVKDLTAVNNVFVSTYSEEIQEWLLSADRKAGDVEYFETTNNYTVIYYDSTALKDYNLKDIEFIFFAVETLEDDDTTPEDESENNDENKAEALKAAQTVLAEYKSGEQTREAFKALGEAKSAGEDAIATSSGTSEATTNEGANPEVEEWLFDEARQVGDVEIIEADEGCYIVYYAAENESYWMASSKASVQNEKYDEMIESIKESYDITYNEEAMDKVVF